MTMTRRLAAIMYTDIAGYTPLAQKDESAALRLLRDQERLVRGLLEVHKGRLVKSMGDGLLIEFANALDAVECAVDLQQHIQGRNAREPPPELRVRIGIHLGDVEESGTDILGDAVNVGSRIEPLAEPGGVCLSEPVYGMVHNKVPYQFEKLGPKMLKGVQEPVGVYRVVLQGAVVATASTPKVSGPPRLAVLPFINISHDPENEYFADGMTEELIAVISQVKGLRVISRTSVTQYKGANKPVAQIGAELGAESVLEGSVRKAGDRLRITVQLIDTKTDEHRWAKTYDRKLEDVFAIQEDVAEQTANALKVELLKSEREVIQEKPTASLAAYEAYLRGIQASGRSTISRSHELDREAVSHFEKAIREDPRFAAASAQLANHLVKMAGETRTWAEVADKARELVSKALELDPNSSEARMAEGNLMFQVDGDWSRAEAEFHQAIALNPSNSMARIWYARLLMVLQRFGEAKKQWQAAIEQDPLNIVPRMGLVDIAWHTGDLGSAEVLLEELVRDFPDDQWPRRILAWLYACTGRSTDAIQAMEALPPASDVVSRLDHARFMAWLGRPEEARAFLAEWEAGRSVEGLDANYLGLLCASIGDFERALALLERSEREGGMGASVVYQNYLFDSIRDDPRFVALLKSECLPTTLSRPRFPPPTPRR